MDKRQIDKLLVKMSHGDNAAFGELYERTKKGVFSFLYSYLKNYENTEDAMQFVYLKIKLSIGQYKYGTNGSAWILQIAKNQALNEINKSNRIDYSYNIAVPERTTVDSGSVIDIMNKVLTDDEQRIVVLHVLWGYKHREIAEQLGCPTGTVTSKYKRSIAKLKQALREVEE